MRRIRRRRHSRLSVTNWRRINCVRAGERRHSWQYFRPPPSELQASTFRAPARRWRSIQNLSRARRFQFHTHTQSQAKLLWLLFTRQHREPCWLAATLCALPSFICLSFSRMMFLSPTPARLLADDCCSSKAPANLEQSRRGLERKNETLDLCARAPKPISQQEVFHCGARASPAVRRADLNREDFQMQRTSPIHCRFVCASDADWMRQRFLPPSLSRLLRRVHFQAKRKDNQSSAADKNNTSRRDPQWERPMRK